MPELDVLREKLRTKLGVRDRRLNQLILKKEGDTLLPRRLAVLALAAENGLPIRRFASDDDLSQLRGTRKSSQPLMEHTRGQAENVYIVGTDEAKRSSKKSLRDKPKPKAATRGRKVFVVYGRNDPMRKSLFTFLRSVGLEPLEWRKAIAATGKGTPTVPDILDAAFAEAIAIVVLLTPDDLVTLAPAFRKSTDPPYEKQVVGQARPNVLFEAGMAFGKNPNATVMVQVGDVKPFSDVGGRHVTRLGNDAESRSEFVTKLRNAGCAVDDSGTDWYSDGDFSVKKERIDGAK